MTRHRLEPQARHSSATAPRMVDLPAATIPLRSAQSAQGARPATPGRRVRGIAERSAQAPPVRQEACRSRLTIRQEYAVAQIDLPFLSNLSDVCAAPGG